MSKCDGRHIRTVTDVTPGWVTVDTSIPCSASQDAFRAFLVKPPQQRGGSPGGGDEVADKKITPKVATKSTAKTSKTEPATRVTKRKQKRARKAAK
jgi:hypothetical protein